MFETARPFLLALALGLLIGIERERSLAGRGEHVALGARTFTLLALLGAIAAHTGSTAVAAVLAAFAGALARYERAADPPKAPAPAERLAPVVWIVSLVGSLCVAWTAAGTIRWPFEPW